MGIVKQYRVKRQGLAFNMHVVMEGQHRRYFNTQEEADVYVDALLNEVNPVTKEPANRMAETSLPRGLIKSPPKFSK
jgi:hypothetical protein